MEVQCIRIHPFIWRAEMDTGNVISVLLNDMQLLLRTHISIISNISDINTNCFREVVELILGRGFDINVRTARGTALHEAALCGKKDVVKYLLDSNVNLELRDHDDKTVLEVMDDLNTPMTREIIHLVLGK